MVRIRWFYLVALAGIIGVALLGFIAGLNTGVIPVGGKKELVRELEADTDGDEQRETLVVYGISGRYELRITSGQGVSTTLTDLGPYRKDCPLYVKVCDINCDAVPEIVSRVKGKDCHQTRIFRWDGREYVRVLSGDFSEMWFNDWDGDGALEVVAAEDLVSKAFHERIYQWNGKKYQPIHYRMNATSRRNSVGGFHHIEVFVEALNKGWDSDNPQGVTSGVTGEWEKDEKQRKVIKNISSGLVAIQMEEVLSYRETDAGAEWDILFRVFKEHGNEVNSEEWRIIFLMDKVTNPVTLEGDYLIDEIQVLSSGDNEHAMRV